MEILYDINLKHMKSLRHVDCKYLQGYLDYILKIQNNCEDKSFCRFGHYLENLPK